MRRLLIPLLFCLTAHQNVRAEDAPLARIALPVAIDFEPSAAACAFRLDAGLSVTRALLIPESRSDGSALEHWLVGCPVPPEGEKISQVSAVIEHAEGASVVHAAPDEVLPNEKLLDSDEEARQYLVKQRELLSSYNVQIKAQEAELSRLRNKADSMGQQGSIAEMEKRVAEGERKLAEAQRDRQNLEGALKGVRVSAAPANSGAMEVEITKQLTELAQAARSAEASVSQRSAAGANPLSERMELIEATRFDDIDKIRAELVIMRKRRQQLEDSLQGGAPSPLDYE